MTQINPKFSIIIVTYNSGQYLMDCITALTGQKNKNFELIIVDNHSDEGLLHSANINSLTHEIINLEKNIGFAAANNIGAKQAAGTWLITLNPDAIPEENWLVEIEAAIRRYPETRIFGSKQIQFDNPDKLDGAGDHYHCTGIAWRGGEGDLAETVSQDAVVMSPCAAAAIYHRDTYLALGGMAEEFFCYYEDVDLGLRFRLSGYKSVQLSNAKVRHIGSATTGKSSQFVKYHVSRNRVWTFIRCVPGLLFVVCLPFLIISIFARLCFSIFAGDSLIKLEAFWDAIVGIPRIWSDRRVIQKARKATTSQFGSGMTWSIGKLIFRATDSRPVPSAFILKDGSDSGQVGGTDGS